MKSKELEEFIKENCIGCQEQCVEGIRELPTFIRCIDKMITKNKKNIENQEEDNV